MAAVEVTITGVLYDKLARTTQNVVLIGEATLTGLGIGGGPIVPPPQQPPSGAHPEHPIYYPPGIWGPTDPRPTPPIANVPPINNPNPPGFGNRPSHPIALPGDPWWPPEAPNPPEMPAPGSPPVIVPGQHPVAPIVPPPAIVVDYPGIGPVLVPQPVP